MAKKLLKLETKTQFERSSKDKAMDKKELTKINKARAKGKDKMKK